MQVAHRLVRVGRPHQPDLPTVAMLSPTTATAASMTMRRSSSSVMTVQLSRISERRPSASRRRLPRGSVRRRGRRSPAGGARPAAGGRLAAARAGRVVAERREAASLEEPEGADALRERDRPLVDLAHEGGLVDRRELAGLEHHLAVDHDRVHVLLLTRVDERRDRVVHRHRLEPGRVEEEQVGEPADLDRPEVVGRPSAWAPPTVASRSASRAFNTRGSCAPPSASFAELSAWSMSSVFAQAPPSVARLTSIPISSIRVIGANRCQGRRSRPG